MRHATTSVDCLPVGQDPCDDFINGLANHEPFIGRKHDNGFGHRFNVLNELRVEDERYAIKSCELDHPSSPVPMPTPGNGECKSAQQPTQITSRPVHDSTTGGQLGSPVRLGDRYLRRAVGEDGQDLGVLRVGAYSPWQRGVAWRGMVIRMGSRKIRRALCHPCWRQAGWLLGILSSALLTASCGATAKLGDAQVTIQSGPSNGGSGSALAPGLELLFLLTLLSLVPALLLVMTSFTRIVIVLSFVRSAIGIPQLPPNQIIVGLALFLTVFVMAPVWQQVNRDALQPYLAGQIDQRTAFTRAEAPLRAFMFKQTRERDIALFMTLGKLPRPRNPDDVPTWVLVPAFILSELKTAFTMGFVLFIPFLIIDLVVSSVLMGMGMIMLPPVLVSLPFKLLLFVMVDGWDLLVRSLVTSFT